eukprot:tig00001107_g7095.t1
MSSEGDLIAECRRKLGLELSPDSELLTACAKVCRAVGIGARQLAMELETYSMNNLGGDNNKLAAKHVDALRSALESKAKSKSLPATTTRPAKLSRPSSDVSQSPEQEERPAKRFAPVSPEQPSRAAVESSSVTREALVDTFKERKKGVVVVKLHEHLSENLKDDSNASFEVNTLGVQLEACPKFMFEPPVDRVNKLQQRLMSVSQMLIENARSGDGDEQKSVEALDKPVQDAVLVRGRIACDGEVPAFALFPGQVVVVEGINPTGRKIYASKIHNDCGLQNDEDAKVELQHGIRVVAAAGPFTTSANEEYDPLFELLETAREFKPHVLLLMGPFIDVQHPSVRDSTLELSFADLFQQNVADKLEKFVSRAPEYTRVFIMPSTRDALHPFPFPQPPLDKENLSLSIPSSVTCIPNPCTLEIAGTKLCIGACSQDVIFALNREELAV